MSSVIHAPAQAASYFHLHLVSDATGETLTTVARAAAAQYTNDVAGRAVYPLVRTHKQLDRVLAEIEESPGIVLYTLLDEELVERLEDELPRARAAVPLHPRAGAGCSSPISAPRTTHRVGAQHVLNAEYFRRIDALNYTMLHDDGQHVDDLEQADVVLVGVSRTSKTPTSIYLANRGVKTAQVPLVPGVPLPPQLEALSEAAGGRALSPARSGSCRSAQNRLLGLNAQHDDDQYVDRAGGRGGGRRLAQAVRQAQLADHRRDAPLDRGNRGRGDGTAGRAPPATPA